MRGGIVSAGVRYGNALVAAGLSSSLVSFAGRVSDLVRLPTTYSAQNNKKEPDGFYEDA